MIIEAIIRRLTGLYMFRRPLGGSRVPKNRSRAIALYAVLLHPHLGRGSMLALPYYPPQTSYTAGTLSAICPKLGLGFFKGFKSKYIGLLAILFFSVCVRQTANPSGLAFFGNLGNYKPPYGGK
jgi:hypothetical protein